MTDLSTVVHAELRTLRDEVGVLRGLLLQSSSFTGGPRLPVSALGNQADRDGTDSPLLTLRSPSPHASPAFPARSIQHQHSLSYLNLPSQPASHLVGPPSPALSAPGGLYQDRAQEDRARDNKDDQIRSLQAQVASLSSSVSQLLGPGPSSHTSVQSPLLSGHSQLQHPLHHQQQRQLSLPPLGIVPHPLGSPSLGGGSPGLGSLVEGWKREVGTGLGVSTTGPGGARSPLLRPLSANGNGGLHRQPSLGSGSFGRPADDERRRSQLAYGVVGQQGMRQDSQVRPLPPIR